MRVFISLFIVFSIGVNVSLASDEEHIHSKSTVGIIDSLLNLSKSFVAIDNDIAQLYANKAITQLEHVSYPDGMIRCFLLKARIAYYNDNYDLAFDLFDSIRPILNFKKASNELASYYSQKALVNSCLGNYEACCMWSLKAIDVNKELGNSSELALGYNFIGRIYLEQGDVDKAEEYYQRAYETIQNTTDNLSRAKIMGNIGLLEEFKGHNQKAFDYYEQSSALFNKRGDLRGMASSLKRMAGIRIKQKDYKNAIKGLEEALSIYQKLDEKYGLTSIYNQLSMAYCKAGNIDKAEYYGKLALHISSQINSKPLIAQAYFRLYEVYVKNGSTQYALNAFKAYEEINTELISWQNNKQIASLEYEAEMRSKEKDIEILSQKNRIKSLQVYILIPFVVMMILGAGGILLFSRMKNRNLQQKQRILEEQSLLAETERELQKQKQVLLENKLELKNRELASKALSVLQMNETLQDVSSKISQLNHGRTLSDKKELNAILQEIQMATNNNIWEEFDTAFNQVHNNFYDKLWKVCPNFSSTEIKIAALLKLNLSTKEIAAISFKSESAIKTTRSRIRTKLDLPRDENLIAFLLKL